MTSLRHILFPIILCATSLLMAQTPFNSFSPETSRPMLMVEDEAYMRQQHQETLPDSMRYAVIVDIQQQAVYLADLSEKQILAIAPLTEDMYFDFYSVRGTSAGVSYNKKTLQPEPQFFFQSWTYYYKGGRK